MIQNILGLKNEPSGSISVTCGNPHTAEPQTTNPQTPKPTTQPTTILKSLRTYFISSVANNNTEAVATTSSYVTSTSVDSTFKDSSYVDSEKQICNCLFLFVRNFKVTNTDLENDVLI